jgi:hypothetical protein
MKSTPLSESWKEQSRRHAARFLVSIRRSFEESSCASVVLTSAVRNLAFSPAPSPDPSQLTQNADRNSASDRTRRYLATMGMMLVVSYC